MSDLAFAIADNLARADVNAEVVPFHNALLIEVIPGKEQVTTGYAGWHYGTVSVLRDNTWDECDCANPEHHNPPDWCSEDEEDPVVIAQGIARFVNERRSRA